MLAAVGVGSCICFDIIGARLLELAWLPTTWPSPLHILFDACGRDGTLSDGSPSGFARCPRTAWRSALKTADPTTVVVAIVTLPWSCGVESVVQQTVAERQLDPMRSHTHYHCPGAPNTRGMRCGYGQAAENTTASVAFPLSPQSLRGHLRQAAKLPSARLPYPGLTYRADGNGRPPGCPCLFGEPQC